MAAVLPIRPLHNGFGILEMVQQVPHKIRLILIQQPAILLLHSELQMHRVVQKHYLKVIIYRPVTELLPISQTHYQRAAACP